MALGRALFEGLGHLLIGQLDFLIIWTGGSKLFPSIGIAQVSMHSTKHIRNGESPVLLTYHLYYVELGQQIAVSQSELIAIQKFPLRDPLILSTGLIYFIWEGDVR